MVSIEGKLSTFVEIVCEVSKAFEGVKFKRHLFVSAIRTCPAEHLISSADMADQDDDHQHLQPATKYDDKTNTLQDEYTHDTATGKYAPQPVYV